MFGYLSSVGAELHTEMLKVYWTMLVPYLAFLFAVELLQSETPNVREILRRTVISILLLYSFDWTLDAIATLGDAVAGRINGIEKLGEVLSHLGPNYSGNDKWFNLRETLLYFLSLLSYMVAYIGFFVATALTHFVWTILYVSSPLMILAFVSPKTSYVTKSLYKGLIQVVLWKILWSLLGVLLLKLAMQPNVSGIEDYLMSIIMNLCIGISMLFIPIATKSLLSDGMSGAAETIAIASSFAAGAAVKGISLAAAKAAGSRGLEGAKFLAAPGRNLARNRIDALKTRLAPAARKIEQAKESWESLGKKKGFDYMSNSGRSAMQRKTNQSNNVEEDEKYRS